ncbi:mRNA capping enzyme, putative [Pediculus humanus corporis]|uniref:mRNA capping enzyme, putative n=1 Tax=Pediculus humanus subsp. corporis TaxID=121224 RepID=E0VYA3_PEDHC|nr:mRNA capping enzyme, putative [Pediculus humanus corporis]EEB18359.1 mRNA capping enzyme, putative [Pediculus humanus corporis]
MSQKSSSFYKEVDTFLSTEPENKLICVHCVHGVNRTGYYICRYMIEKLKFTPEDAIKGK